MKRRPRIRYTEEQKALMWDRWQQGESLHAIAGLFDRNHGSIAGVLGRTGGIRPAQRKRSRLALTLAEREEISRGLARLQSMRSIAAQLGRSTSTVSREVARNGGYACYRASVADQAAWRKALRPKACMLAGRPELVRVITRKLQCQWSPEQIAGWLKRRYPDEHYHVSHETIYKSLFIQARGVLKKELLACLRTQRVMRRSKHASFDQ
jgi:IS30 family transposase